MEFYFGTVVAEKIILDKDESHHLHVRRAVEGDEVTITDGKGKIYSARLLKIGKNSSELEILSEKVQAPLSPYLHIAIAPTKSIDRIEWFLEKAVETGINEISFLLCRHSERK